MRLWTTVLAALLIAACSADAGMAKAVVTKTSKYVAMSDRTRLAVDVWMNGKSPPPRSLPTILKLTRYWRSASADNTTHSVPPDIEYFTNAGYVVVVADMRGTGASFGHRTTEFSDEEVQDYGNLIDWISRQGWSNGRVATLGTSYLGNTAELAAIPQRTALRAVVPRFSDFSEYNSAIRPGGILNAVIARAWVNMTAALDRDDPCSISPKASACAHPTLEMGVAPVDGDARSGLLRSALREHEENTNLANVVSSLVYSDDPFSDTGNDRITLDYVSPAKRWPQIDSAKVPAYHWASWFDGGTAAGVLTRYINYKTPIKIIIGAWNHGGTTNANPYKGRQGGQPDPSVAQQFADIKRFLDPLLKSDSVIKPEQMKTIAYYTIGSNQWRTTDVWPPRGIGTTRLFFGANGGLTRQRPKSTRGADLYKVDFSATTGTHNRWHTQLGTYVDYPDRREEDKKLITYTSETLAGQVEITGSPVVAIRMKSSRPDGALFVYLEDVSPDGRVTYLTEGEQRIIFNGAAATEINYKSLGPPHSFVRADSRQVKAESEILMSFALNPISVVLPAGHRIRIAIAGADADTFERLPGDNSSLAYEILRNRVESSFIDLPTQIKAGARPFGYL